LPVAVPPYWTYPATTLGVDSMDAALIAAYIVDTLGGVDVVVANS